MGGESLHKGREYSNSFLTRAGKITLRQELFDFLPHNGGEDPEIFVQRSEICVDRMTLPPPNFGIENNIMNTTSKHNIVISDWV